jgi:hypothetical protein
MQIAPRVVLQVRAMYSLVKSAISHDERHYSLHRQASCDRKGNLTQNCLAACNFDMHFTYMLSGFQGSAADARVYHIARLSNFTIPPGKMYLANAEFAACDELLVPYRGIRYHLAEWDRANLLYVDSGLTVLSYLHVL